MEKELKNLDNLQTGLAEANRRTATLQNPIVHNFSRRKQTVATEEESSDTHRGTEEDSQPSSRRGEGGRSAIYRKSRGPGQGAVSDLVDSQLDEASQKRSE